MGLRNKKARSSKVKYVKSQKAPEVKEVRKLIDEVSGTDYKELEVDECQHRTVNKYGKCLRCEMIVGDCEHTNIYPSGKCGRCGKMVRKVLKSKVDHRRKLKVCLDRGKEHTVYWTVATKEAPYVMTFMTKKENHEEAMIFVNQQIANDQTTFWAKSFCTDLESNICFEWND